MHAHRYYHACMTLCFLGHIEYEDLWGKGSVAYSKSVIRAYMSRYAMEQTLGRTVTNEDIARIHNGGPNGWNNPNTQGYWTKISNQLSRSCAGMDILYDGMAMCIPCIT